MIRRHNHFRALQLSYRSYAAALYSHGIPSVRLSVRPSVVYPYLTPIL